jgi:hypothetical protein
MTDGANSLYYRSSDGVHPGNGNDPTVYATRQAAANLDVLSLCTYAKTRNIAEAAATSSMLSACATDADHFYAAANQGELEQAFQEIGESLSVVRLTQ